LHVASLQLLDEVGSLADFGMMTLAEQALHS
jgi:hypothetical protein